MFPATRGRILPSLQDLTLQSIIQTNPVGGRIPPNAPIPDEVRLPLARWQYLKENAPLGPLDIATIMNAVEEGFQVSKPLNLTLAEKEYMPALTYQQSFPRTFRVNLLFHELQRQLEPKMKEYGASLQQIPLRLATLEDVQYVIHRVEEDRALMDIWRQLIAEQLITPAEPIPTTVQGIRAWLNDPAHAPEIEEIDMIDLSGFGIKVLPQEIGLFRGLRELHLDNNNLKYLPESLCHLPALRILYVAQNHLVELPQSFGNLTTLTDLNLNDNKLTKLPESFVNLTALTDLYCNSNELNQLPIDFDNLTALTTLELNDNRLAELPESFGRLTSLTELDLSLNHLTALPDSFGHLTALVTLRLASNNFAIFPEPLRELTALEGLILSDNRLTTLPDFTGQLPALNELNLGYNRLEEIPETLGELSTLEILHLAGNNLRHLPTSLGNLRLLYLDLQDNRIENLPESFGNLRTLNSLKLGNNLLVRLPASFRAMLNGEATPFEYHFELEGNPLLCISNQELEEIQDLESFIRFEDEAINYTCQSPQAQFFQALICRNFDAARVLRSELETSTELDHLGRVLRTRFLNQFDQLETKEEVYLEYSRLAGQGDDAEWGEEHLFDHMLRLIDAMEAVSRKRKAGAEPPGEPTAKKHKLGE